MRFALTVLMVLLPACGMIPSEMRAPIDAMIKDNGAGDYWLACQGGKDERQLVGVRGNVECTANTMQLTGCHPKGVTVEGPK